MKKNEIVVERHVKAKKVLDKIEYDYNITNLSCEETKNNIYDERDGKR